MIESENDSGFERFKYSCFETETFIIEHYIFFTVYCLKKAQNKPT